MALSLFAPLPGAPLAPARARAASGQEGRPEKEGRADKMTGVLLARARGARPGGRERTRVILSVRDDESAERASLALQSFGASVRTRLDGVGALVADVPVNRLAEVAAREDVAWVSDDQEVRSLAAAPDNTSHAEVTTGASKLLPVGNDRLARGGGGNRVGIAVLDSGISPPDAAEFAGYYWDESGGVLSLGLLLSQPVLESYNRIVKKVDFTGEGVSADDSGPCSPHEMTRPRPRSNPLSLTDRRASGRLRTSTTLAEAVMSSNVFFLCVCRDFTTRRAPGVCVDTPRGPC